MSIQCYYCGRFMAYKDFEEGKTTEVEAWDRWDEPPEWAPVHKWCVENQIEWKPK